MKRTSSAILLLVVVAIHAYGQDRQSPSSNEVLSIGTFVGYASTLLSSDFAFDRDGLLTPTTECGRFQDGRGRDLMVGALVEVPAGDRFRFSLRSAFSLREGTIRYQCIDPAGTRMPDGSTATALTDHVAELSSSTISIRVDGAWMPLQIPLQIAGGGSVSLPLEYRYEVHEEIVQPKSAEFFTGGQVRRYAAGTFSTNPTVSLVGATRYRAQVGERWTLLPEAGYRLALNAEVSEADLRSRGFFATLGLLYRIDHEKEPVVVPTPIVDAPLPRLELDLSLHAATSAEDMEDTLRVRTHRTIITEVHPLLNFIFFDSASARIPERYHRRTPAETSVFTEQSIRSSDNLQIYYNVLDIIGSRLRRFPDATLSLTGTQPDLPTTGGTFLRLAEQRAGTIAEYLQRSWAIAPERMTILARQTPATPSNPEKPEGAEENRRVEIMSTDPRITDAVLLSDTIRRREAPRLIVEPDVLSEAGVRSWEATIGGSSDNMIRIGEEGWPRRVELTVDSILSRLPSSEAMLPVFLTIRDSSGQMATARSTISVRPVQGEDSVRYGAGFYSLILFDFGRSQLSPAHLRMIEIVNARASSESRARVYGFSDRMGELSLNQQLSTERATEVAGQLKATVVESIGRGVNTRQYDNNLPEGRFYSRSVTIETENDENGND